MSVNYTWRVRREFMVRAESRADAERAVNALTYAVQLAGTRIKEVNVPENYPHPTAPEKTAGA